jgi:hypothetical protein
MFMSPGVTRLRLQMRLQHCFRTGMRMDKVFTMGGLELADSFCVELPPVRAPAYTGIWRGVG